MKKKSFIYLCLILTISNSTFAGWTFQGKGRVINAEQHLGSGTLGGGLIDHLMSIQDHENSNLSINAKALSAKGTVNSTFNVYGQHRIFVKNSTLSVQRYQYAYEICVNHSHCMYYSGNIELNPGSTGQHRVISYVVVQLSLLGTYLSEVKTNITGEQHAFLTHQGLIIIG